MTTPNPACLVNGSPTPQDVAATSTVTGGLADATGARFWGLTCISTDETTTAAAINATLVLNQTTKTFSYTAAGLGTKARFRSQVGIEGLGTDANNQPNPDFTTTFVVNVKASNGLRVMCLDEKFDQDSTFGWIGIVNAAIRLTGGGGVGTGFVGIGIDASRPSAAGTTALYIATDTGKIYANNAGTWITILGPAS